MLITVGFCCWLFIIIVGANTIKDDKKYVECIYSRETGKGGVRLEVNDYERGEIYTLSDSMGNRTVIKCAADEFNCYSLWEDRNGDPLIKAQGCWQGSKDNNECQHSECVSKRRPMKLIKEARFCCCTSDYCNSNVSHNYDPSKDRKIIIPHVEKDDYFNDRLIFLFALMLTLCVISIMITLSLRKMKLHKRFLSRHRQSSENHLLSNHCVPESMSIQSLQLTNIIGKGKFGSVWKGEVNGKDIAVKIFPSHYKNFFINERDIYLLPFMDHSNILKYFGSNERFNLKGETEYLLMIAYASNGCLQVYLSFHTISFDTFYQMSSGIAKGLAYLHSEITKGNQIKPCISHRDLNSRNILVNKDLTCCICDLGLAIPLSGSSFYENGEKQYAKNKRLNEVGTIRYMAPEILEGSVNLNDCELSLKQVDIYALGLVLWELATRCFDFYQTIEIPDYELPFKLELGNNPNMENMQTLVSLNKFRPLFPSMWYNNSLIFALKETISDCWDEDAEARLTASCVAERLSELSALRKKSLAPQFSTQDPHNSNENLMTYNDLNINKNDTVLLNRIEFSASTNETFVTSPTV